MTELSPTPPADAVPDWQRSLANAVRDPATLISHLGLAPGLLDGARRGAALFPIRVPWEYVERMRPGDPADPLLRQVLPLDAETMHTPGYVADPVGDLSALHDGGVLHKYRGRALLVATGACAVHCRYCFRRHFPYAEANASSGGWAAALNHLEQAGDVEEVILSGGDPLSLNDRRLSELARGLDGIAHLRRLRVHTRLPVVLPSRVDEHLLSWLATGRLRPVMVLHVNHPAEVDDAVARAAQRLREAGVELLNQAVLLRGVNDDSETIARLSERLFDIRVAPYYLHMLDPVSGASHFDVTMTRARGVMQAAAARLPGYLVPRLVRELPGAAAKTWVHWDDRPGSDGAPGAGH